MFNIKKLNSISPVYHSILPKEEAAPAEEAPAEKKPAIDKKKDYLLKENSVDQTLTYKVAECCNPIPGDAIVGFVDADNNVVVHKKICPKAHSNPLYTCYFRSFFEQIDYFRD